MPTFLHAECSCGKTLRARPDQAGGLIRCWSCGGAVAVPHPDQSVRLAGAMADAAPAALRAAGPFVVGGAAAITAALLVPRFGTVLALALVAAAVRGYGAGVRAAARGPAPADEGAGGEDDGPTRWVSAARGGLAVAAALALVAPLLVRNRGYVLPPYGTARGVLGLTALAFAGWLVMPVALAAAYAHDRRGPVPPRPALAALARHPLAVLAALLVVPLGLLLTEAVVALVAWQLGQLPLMVADLFPPPRSEYLRNGRHLFFEYDGATFVRNYSESVDTVETVYPHGLRRGFTLVGTVPPSLSVGLLWVRGNPWEYEVSPAAYLVMRIFLTLLTLSSAGALLAVQARWLGLIAALDSRRATWAR